jgi:hypothetical protein
MRRNHTGSRLRNRLKSLAKWKRDAEAWYKQDSAMFNGLLHMVETNVVCVSRIFVLNHYYSYSLFRIGKGG